MSNFPHTLRIGYFSDRYGNLNLSSTYAFFIRFTSSFVVTLVIVCLLSSCRPEDAYRSYAGSVGPDLYSAKSVNNTRLLDSYVSNICRQAGLTKDGVCTIGSTTDWKTFVDMGLYDIDERCDTFLDRLYYKDKTYDPILTQISDTRSFTGAVLDATKSTKMAISIVAAAFSLAESSFRNTRGSLLEALDPTTVKSIVFRRQQQIKKEIYGTQISSKPQALHALRAYLRVCMPFTIEMEANALITTLQRTDEVGKSPISFDASTYRKDLQSNAETPADKGSIPPNSPINSPGDLGEIEQKISPEVHQQFARAICDTTMSASANDFGPAGNATRAKIAEWEAGLALTEGPKVVPNGKIDTAYENEAMLALIARDNPYKCGIRSPMVKTASEAALLGTAVKRVAWRTRIQDYLDAIKSKEFGKDCGAGAAGDSYRQTLALDQSAGFGPASRKALLAGKRCLLKSPTPPQIADDDVLEPVLIDRMK
ncbi:hypothetical protein [Agrobacterium tumefaciens]|uniref:hypothetical protein n=1 Tax=Agrobacterium tumefaciens TaxID=358 RepID=UPI002244C466|nr:hypothetical protein [Agrobacterium tumefaciens]MCW8060115.1 hypothetical protein [Agrobacterium tumefaciens]